MQPKYLNSAYRTFEQEALNPHLFLIQNAAQFNKLLDTMLEYKFTFNSNLKSGNRASHCCKLNPVSIRKEAGKLAAKTRNH